VPSSSSGVFLSLVDASSSSSSSSSSLHRFVLDMHQANVLPRPVPAKMTKHLRRHGLLLARKAEAAREEEEAERRAETMRTFRGLKLLVPRAGLVPKESSGVLVDAAVAVLRQGKGKRAAILDLGTGSGALLLATLKEEAAGESMGVGIDLDVDALEAARRNALALGLASQTTFIRMDFGLLHEEGGASSLSLGLAPSSASAPAVATAPAVGFSVVVSNPPYLAASKAAGRITSEGGLALVGGGNDGLGSYFAICSSLSRLVDQHPALLSPDCLLEVDVLAEVSGINDRLQLAQCEAVLQERLRRHWMAEGVSFSDPASCTLSEGTRFGRDVLVEPQCHFRGNTTIGNGCRIGPGCLIENSSLADGVEVLYSVLRESSVETDCVVGPYAQLRNGAHLEAGCRIGNFVEVKNSRLGAGVKANHLSYLGDADLGANVNVGAGTITANFDGVHKHRTVIGAGSKTGANSVLVAPITLGAEVTVAAGSTLTQNVPDGALAFGRARQVVKERRQTSNPAR
jgi:methylase of polypeptide subunit release factors/acetyltransferase-like isoleucine patch superfamily enzyme